MEIIDNVTNPRWKKISCSCDHSSVLTEYPIKDCVHCKCEEAENSIPQNNFTIKDRETKQDIIISKIKILRGNKLQDCIGWEF